MRKQRRMAWSWIAILVALVIVVEHASSTVVNCGMKQLAADLARRILPGCIAQQPQRCNVEHAAVINSLGLCNVGRRMDEYVPSSVTQTGVLNEKEFAGKRILAESSSSPPSETPTTSPSISPFSSLPSRIPSVAPWTSAPSISPSTSTPSISPSTSKPSQTPSVSPSTHSPSRTPSDSPLTFKPSQNPSIGPSYTPPTSSPSTSRPSKQPSKHPMATPSSSPQTSLPSHSPSKGPSTSKPSRVPSRTPSSGPTKPKVTKGPTPLGITIYVNPTEGSDVNDGLYRTTAVKTIGVAVARIRENPPALGPKVIVLMAGKHRLIAPVRFGPSDSGLTIKGDSGAIVTGAINLSGLTWTQESVDIFSATVPADMMDLVDTLSVLSYNGEPMIRARFPNIDVYTESGNNWASKAGSIASSTSSPVLWTFSRRLAVNILPGVKEYGRYFSASGGPCNGVFSPPVGYFCDNKADADLVCPFTRLTSITFTPATSTRLGLRNWSRRSVAYVHTLHPRKWGGWTFRASGVSKMPNQLNLAEGAFQEARGDCRAGGGAWFVENVPELLDSPNEFFLDKQTRTIRMRLPSTSTAPPNLVEMELGSSTTRLFEFLGVSSKEVVTNIVIENIRFERTSPIHMLPHEMPSGGDWSIHRSGTLFFENARSITIIDCLFSKLGSHGIFLSNHIRDVTIIRNNFYGIDGTAIAMVGDPKYDHPQPWDRTIDSDYVAGVTIRNNVISKIGLMLVQSAGVFGSLAKDILVYRNVIYDGPRAAVVYNDLFGNGLVTRENVMFNMVLTTDDHGPYNVWDRQQWRLPVGFKDSANIVDRNFFIGTFGGFKVVDPDDGARSHIVTNNVIGNGYMKFKGGNITATKNVVLAYLRGLPSCVFFGTSHQKVADFRWYGNACYAPVPPRRTTKVAPYSWLRGLRGCNSAFLKSSSNKFYGTSTRFSPCARTRQAWQRRVKQDKGSVFSRTRPGAEALAAASTLMQTFGVGP